jgi:hypothetical protein
LDLIFRRWGGRGNEIRSQPTRRQPKRQDAPHWAETRCFVFIKAYLCRRRLSHLTSSPGHAGAGGARSWAINIRISWNICRGTATHYLGADLDQLLAQAGQRPRLHRLRHRQRPHEIAEIVGQRVELEADGVGGEGLA